jgi:rRNA-processing protein FCF1
LQPTAAGDLLFLAMAAGDGQPIITEDDELIRKARQVGLPVFRIADYLSAACSR